MSAQPDLTMIRAVIHNLFPWMPKIEIDAATKALVIKSASTLLRLAGDATARYAARKGDFVVRLFWHSTASTLYYSTSLAAPYSWSPVASGALAPTNVDAGTAITITEGSAKVQVG